MSTPNISEEYIHQQRVALGAKLKAIRLERGLTLEQVGELIGTGKSTVSKIEAGTWNASISWFILFAHALEFDISFILK
ncbi:helix-turn-helix domain-containing protein [Mucilaginibacter xinganensis]|uniref:Helix-turn-helix protein n=1 Tax=Mucilaginibacter xinganensis TaxID=1234841 RepID=A0A223NWX9_9SPHI|nr:helix-turn-helix transcriptional regulator [Mucilaginibacter xinganensis]ASU34383.1 helix-turn-helix protein [Mucilaginibacter xinganensis]